MNKKEHVDIAKTAIQIMVNTGATFEDEGLAVGILVATFEKLQEPIYKAENEEHLTVDYLMELHPELSKEGAEDLLAYCHKETIRLKMCYGSGQTMLDRWRNSPMCDCGNKANSHFSPCCSYHCWNKKFQ